MMKVEDIWLVKTCAACPEQYNAYDRHGRKVGYLRLRNGYFSVTFPDAGGEEIFSASLPESVGTFDSKERETYLEAAKKAIAKHIEAVGPVAISNEDFDDF